MAPEPEPDAWKLVLAAQTGDPVAFAALYRRYAGLVHRYTLHRTGDHGLAEDLTSETFLRALRRIGTLRYQGRDPGAWLVTIARNLVFDHLKSSRHRLEVPTEDPNTRLLSQHWALDPEQQVIARLTLIEVTGQLGRLVADQQECLRLRFLQGLSVAETAHRLGRNEAAVRALQQRAVRRLAGLLRTRLR
ncbi:sigma-70 family RNA polymerase sigma factor [Actinoalloteichus hymeniacidonis]|uniref:RNA polymerase sigma factor, sigma-70 family n=1 Tax=Actinoalloteichus hymeniacidonis TaxID=340345 RepID=A0AAC9MWY8_9PSEU|nr:sigma-70 family RNA polymerase sigma factor [Actinoalloteichus hymeniacidonis]AOS61307.1 RNA polymerase sigma factor, sigma-70 family [Actinoalloteichus hymeniacidonis]MBB5910688.1 RNA polymerase sigma-70 factor (ECF subfamily) [Actinoalloteichus hymeniacidonis]